MHGETPIIQSIFGRYGEDKLLPGQWSSDSTQVTLDIHCTVRNAEYLDSFFRFDEVGDGVVTSSVQAISATNRSSF